VRQLEIVMANVPRPQRRALIIGCGIAGHVTAMALQRCGFETVIYEAQKAPADHIGLFLGLSPNGVNVLKSLGLDRLVEDVGSRCSRAVFANGYGKTIGEADMGGDAERFGAHTIMIKRARLHKVLREEAIRRGIPILFDHRLQDIEFVEGRRARARFAGGREAVGDLVVGCDGIHSRVRDAIMPITVKPPYTGVVGCGGLTRSSIAGVSPGVLHLTFGRRAFFGYFTTRDGETFWFNNVAWPQEPTKEQLAAISPAEWRSRLLALHGNDHRPIPAIIRATQDDFLQIPIYDMPNLPRWQAGPVCLVGDAAHATSPHGGQGASMALEDAVMLAKCVSDNPDLAQALATYQSLRKPRVEKLVLRARRRGEQRALNNSLALWLRDLLLPLFLRLDARSMDWVYSYRVNWERPPPAQAA
jgi:2-polyprenyl-6-methoxyphenol hydroxylase-like FAD-dependent oxidoreductase